METVKNPFPKIESMFLLYTNFTQCTLASISDFPLRSLWIFYGSSSPKLFEHLSCIPTLREVLTDL